MCLEELIDNMSVGMFGATRDIHVVAQVAGHEQDKTPTDIHAIGTKHLNPINDLVFIQRKYQLLAIAEQPAAPSCFLHLVVALNATK